MWCAAFGRPVDEVFSSLSVEPVASASLGQVYKGRLRDMYGGGEVAVKVQRPHVQASVALDLLLMRRFAAFSQTFPQVSLKPALCTGLDMTLTAAMVMAMHGHKRVVLFCAQDCCNEVLHGAFCQCSICSTLFCCVAVAEFSVLSTVV